mmetsp:Transcript_22347/g.69253  ORF Transcript_22347/g.69253 Transcript_22347/m.69253 type:complete len:257 (+) Transcript_22347:1303-2073(+)
MVRDLPFVKKDGVVKHVEDLGAGLVHRAEHRHTTRNQPLQCLHERIGCVRVQAAQGLVKEEHLGVGDEFDTHGGPLALATRDAFHQRRAHDRVGTLGEVQRGKQPVYEGLALSTDGPAGQPHIGGKLQALTGRLCGHQTVVLHHVGNVATEGVRVDERAGCVDLPLKYHTPRVRALPPCQDVKECALAAAGWTQDPGEAARLHEAGDVLEDLLVADAEGKALPLQRQALLLLLPLLLLATRWPWAAKAVHWQVRQG